MEFREQIKQKARQMVAVAAVGAAAMAMHGKSEVQAQVTEEGQQSESVDDYYGLGSYCMSRAIEAHTKSKFSIKNGTVRMSGGNYDLPGKCDKGLDLDSRRFAFRVVSGEKKFLTPRVVISGPAAQSFGRTYPIKAGPKTIRNARLEVRTSIETDDDKTHKRLFVYKKSNTR